jgi:hypothetical protein
VIDHVTLRIGQLQTEAENGPLELRNDCGYLTRARVGSES